MFPRPLHAVVIAQSIPVEVVLDIRSLYAAYHPRLFRFGLAFSGSESKAAEAVQDAFLDLIRNPGQFDPSRGTEVALLFGMVRNRLRSARRSEREEPLDEDGATDEELLVHLEREERIVAVRGRFGDFRSITEKLLFCVNWKSSVMRMRRLRLVFLLAQYDLG